MCTSLSASCRFARFGWPRFTTRCFLFLSPSLWINFPAFSNMHKHITIFVLIISLSLSLFPSGYKLPLCRTHDPHLSRPFATGHLPCGPPATNPTVRSLLDRRSFPTPNFCGGSITWFLYVLSLYDVSLPNSFLHHRLHRVHPDRPKTTLQNRQPVTSPDQPHFLSLDDHFHSTGT